MKEDLLRFIDAADAKIDFAAPVDIYLVGGAALLLAYGSTYGTKDIDLIGREDDANLRRLAALFPERSGAGGALDFSLHHVNEAIPRLHPIYRQRARVIEPGRWLKLRVFVLDPMDLVLSKLQRFSPTDRRDIRHLCTAVHQEIDPAELARRLQEMGDWDEDDFERFNGRLLRVIEFWEGRSNDL
jgi:hypothetical protein